MGSVILTDDPGQSVRGFPIAWMIWWEKRRPLDPMEYRKKNSQKKTPAKIGRQNCDMRKEKHTAYIKLYGAGDLYLNKRFPKPADKHRGHFMESWEASFPMSGYKEALPHGSPGLWWYNTVYMIDFIIFLAYNGISQKDRTCIHARIPPEYQSGGISLG